MANWPAIVDRVRAVRISIGSYLEEGKPLEAADGKVVVGFPGEHRLGQELLEQAENRGLVEKTAGEILKKKYRFEFKIAEAMPKAASAPSRDGSGAVEEEPAEEFAPEESESIVDAARRIFKGKIIKRE